MGSFALVSLEVDLSHRALAAEIATELVDTFPGTRNVTLDAATGALTFEMIFPGNLSALVARLRSNLIATGDRATVSLPIRRLVPDDGVDAEHVARTLQDGPEIWDVALRPGRHVVDAGMSGDVLQATVLPSSNSMHQLYDSLLHLGIVADGQTQDVRSL